MQISVHGATDVGLNAEVRTKSAPRRAPDGDEGRRQIVAYMQGRIDAIRLKLPRAFRRMARGNPEIRRMPLAQEPGAPAAYGGPGSIDGQVPGKVGEPRRSVDP